MADFNTFVQTELPKRPFVNNDGLPGQMLVRSTNGLAIRELIWADVPTGGGGGPSDTTTNLLLFDRSNEDYVDLPKGTPVFAYSATGVRRAVANDSSGSWKIIGLAVNTILYQSSGTFQAEGKMVLTVSDWDLLTGEYGGLVAGRTYFLHPTEIGKITQVPPSNEGEYLSRVGVAYSPTELYIDIGLCIKL